MDSRVISWIFGLIALAAVAFAIFTYFDKSNANPTITASIAPTATNPILLTSPTPVSSSSPSTSPSPTTAASSTREFKASQNLSLPSEVDAIGSGGSLSGIAQDHGVGQSVLAKINNISDPNTVYAGQTIIIPDDVSDNVYTILFVPNPLRLDKEKKKIQAGGSSLYADAVSAAHIDTKGIYGLASDTPFSQSDANDTAVTLSSSDDTKIVTITMQKDSSGLWLTKKLVIKVTKTE